MSAVSQYLYEFHAAFGVDADPDRHHRDLVRLRARLLMEECAEAVQALYSGNLSAMAQELADVVYVAYGAAESLGIDLDAAITAVHRANMSKLGDDGKPIYDAGGKVLKGPNYRYPDMTAAVYPGGVW